MDNIMVNKQNSEDKQTVFKENLESELIDKNKKFKNLFKKNPSIKSMEPMEIYKLMRQIVDLTKM